MLLRTVGYGLLFSTSISHAMSISPILVDLSPQKKVASVTLVNTSDKKLRYQVNSLSWSQVDGKNEYQETKDLLVVPAMVEIAPGASQIFRVTSRHPQANSIEKSYRLVLENLTVDEPKDLAKANQLILRISHDIPVFLAPIQQKNTSSRWIKCTAPVGKGCIRIENTGTGRISFSDLYIQSKNWKQDLNVNDTVLAGAWKQWIYDLPNSDSMPITIQLKTLDGIIEPVQGP